MSLSRETEGLVLRLLREGLEVTATRMPERVAWNRGLRPQEIKKLIPKWRMRELNEWEMADWERAKRRVL